MVKYIANINSNIVTFDSIGTLGTPGIKTSTIEHTTSGSGSVGEVITADGNGSWSWSQPSPTDNIAGSGINGYVSYFTSSDITTDTSGLEGLSKSLELAEFGNTVTYSTNYFTFLESGKYKISIYGLFRTTNSLTTQAGAPNIYLSYSENDGVSWTSLEDVLYLKNVAETNSLQKPFNSLSSDGIIEVADYSNFKLRVNSTNFGNSNGAKCSNFRIDFMNMNSIYDANPDLIWIKKANNDTYYDGGNVGIGITTPGAKLDVDGSINGGATTVSNLTTSGDITVNGKITLADYWVSGITTPTGNHLRLGANGAYALIFSNTSSQKYFSPYTSTYGTIDLGEATSPWNTLYTKYINTTHQIISQAGVVDSFTHLGQVTIGNVRNQSAATNESGICHRNWIGWNKFALMQNNSGNTSINGWSNVSIRVQWGSRLYVDAYNVWVQRTMLPDNNAGRDLGSSSRRWRNIYAWNSVIQTSDDRHKINERPINNALGLLQQLQLYEYEKVKTMNGTDVTGTERGVLAQDLLNTELAFAVSGGGTEEVTHRDDDDNITKETVDVAYSVRYNDLFVTALQAVKELDAIVQAQQSKIDSLEEENTLMKSKLNEILTEMGKETI